MSKVIGIDGKPINVVNGRSVSQAMIDAVGELLDEVLAGRVSSIGLAVVKEGGTFYTSVRHNVDVRTPLGTAIMALSADYLDSFREISKPCPHGGE